MKDMLKKIGLLILYISVWFIVFCLSIGLIVDTISIFKDNPIKGMIVILAVIVIIVLNILIPDKWRKY